MNIILRELKATRKSLIIWNICMFLLVYSGMAKYAAYSSGTTSSINDILKTMPVSLKGLLGFGSFDVSTMSGYFAVLFIYIELTVAIHAVLLGAGIISKEERDKTAEFLMIKPVSRGGIITSKLIAALLIIIIINIVTYLSSIVLVPAYNNGRNISSEISAMVLSMFFVQLIFLSLGILLAACMRNSKASIPCATGILLAAYFISRITDISEKLKFLNLFSPFKYFDLYKIVAGNGLDVSVVLLSFALVVVFTALTYVFYQNRDLRL